MSKFLRWIPAILLMSAIFAFSSIPSTEMPSFDWADTLIKKGGHVTGYALLALAYWYALGWESKRWWLPILLAVLYSASDEFHQSFVPGRHSSPVDVLVFDNGGAMLGVALKTWLSPKKQKAGDR
jgi:VanZ family protein